MLVSRCSNYSLLHSPKTIKPKYMTSKTNLLPRFSPYHHLQRIGFNHDIIRYSCSFIRHSHPPSPVPEDGHAGIGILEFFQGKNIFITGGTGLLGKVLVEKILRSTSVGKVYLLINAKDEEAAFHRLEDEIINSELFTQVKEKHGKCYGGFVREKVIPIAGNICEPNLGMDDESIDEVRRSVDVIVSNQKSTTN